MNRSAPPLIRRHVPAGQICCDPQWEAAYRRFETPEQEIAKFTARLRRFGFDAIDRDRRIVEVFCGRGNGLVALERMGFRNVEGVDLSDSLLEEYRGPATLHLADCTALPLADNDYDIAIVQGGLHHLPQLPADLDRTLAGVARITKSDGRFYVVEPWKTPFLVLAHAITDRKPVRKLYPRGDALATMTERERPTYEQWLAAPDRIRESFERHFRIEQWQTRFGKLNAIVAPRENSTETESPPAST